MNRKPVRALAVLWVFAGLACAGAQEKAPPSEIRLLVRADDMAVSHGVNVGCIETFRSGIARSVEVIVPGPWFLEAVKVLKEHPKYDVGIHLCLTSEWENVKWGPLTRAPSLVDKNGYFFPMTRQKREFPPGTGFLESGFKIEEVEQELRAQIELIKRHLPRLSHMSAHMGTASSTPELRALLARLAKEYGLEVNTQGLRRFPRWSGKDLTPGQKEQNLVEALEKLTPGTWMLVEHPATDSPESKAIGHRGYENVAADRAGVTHALTSAKVKAVIKKRGIKLISYLDLKEDK